MTKHKNSNDAVGHFCIYQIMLDGKIYKVGKADYDRITLSSGLPTRIHQQIRILDKIFTPERISHKILRILIGVSTLEAKTFEKKVLKMIYLQKGEVPTGNSKSFKP